MSVWEFGYKGKPQYKDDTGFRRNMYGDISTIKKWVLTYGPKDIYTSVFKYESTNVTTSKLEAGLYFDIDNEDNLKVAHEDLLALVSILQSHGIERELFYTWFSGFKGFHLTIPWSGMGVAPASDLPAVYKKIAIELNQFLPNKNIDFAVYESKRLWRFPNTINSKSGLYKIPLQNDILTLDQIKELAKTPQPAQWLKPVPNKILTLWVDRARRELEEESRPKNTDRKFNSYGVKSDVQEILHKGVTSNRNNTTFYLACYLESKGWAIDRATQELLAFGERCTPPASANHSEFNQAAIARTVRSAYKNKRAVTA